ncbi:MAG: GNAT family N-acetyltransferase [Meiothermus silvanus]|nr:GNAT family N-acetyltransferase [Allomeiothermus silvanus]MCL6568840.1 GNAT family N-acetyltransferase [Allomeiothermus silvanus]
MIVAQTDRLLLRHLHLLDAQALYGVFGDPEVMRFSEGGVQSREWVTLWLRSQLEHYARWGFGRYAVLERSRPEVIGYCGLAFHPDLGGRPEVDLGYRLARRSWGHGYATEAARAVVAYAFDTLGLGRLVATIDPQNLASLRVAEKIGMRYEKDLMLEGYTHPDRLYVITPQGFVP